MISGLVLLPIAVLFASGEVLGLIPVGVLGVLLLFTAIELARHGIKTDSYLVTATVAVFAVVINISVAFIVGLAIVRILRRSQWRPGEGGDPEGGGDARRAEEARSTDDPGVS